MVQYGSKVEFVEDENTIYLSGPEWRDFLHFAGTTLLIIGVLQLVSIIVNSQAVIVFVASVLTISQTMWHLRDKEDEKSKQQIAKAISKLDDYPGTSAFLRAGTDVVKSA